MCSFQLSPTICVAQTMPLHRSVPPSIGRGVMLKGLPFSITRGEIKSFFKSLVIPDDSIRLLTYDDGKGSGLAFVRLDSEEEIRHAVLMDKNHIGSRYVEVAPSDESEMWELVADVRMKVIPSELYKKATRISGSRRAFKATDVEASEARIRDRSPIRNKLLTRFCYVTGVPEGSNYKGVRQFFAGCLIGRNCVHLMRKPNGIFTGEAYVEFSNEDECLKGLVMDGKQLQGSVLNVYPCSEVEVNDMTARLQYEDQRDEFGGDRPPRAGRQRARTPPTVKRRKEAYEEKYLYGREQEEALFEQSRGGGFDRQSVTSYGSPYSRGVALDRGGYSSLQLSDSTRLAASTLPQEPYEFRRVQHSDFTGHSPSSLAGDGYGGTGYSPEVGERGRERGRERGNGGGERWGERSGGYGTPRLATYETAQVPMQTRSGGYADDMRLAPLPPISSSPHSSSFGPEPGYGRERKSVRMEGLAYDASVGHILQFFTGYNLAYESVRIQCRDDGSPSGKAFVTFPSEKTARSAVYELNKKYLGGRYVELILV